MANPLLRLLGNLRPYWKKVLLATMMLASVTIIDLSIPRLIQYAVDLGIIPRDMNVIVMTTLLMLGLSVLDVALAIGNNLLSVRIAQSFGADVRSALFHKIQGLSFGNLDKYQTGELMVRLTSDINQIQTVVLLSMRMFIRVPLLLTGSLILMVFTARELAAILMVPLLSIMVVSAVFVYFAQPMYQRVQKKLDKLNQVLQENFEGVRVVKAFVRAEYEIRRFDGTNVELMKESTKVASLLSVLNPTMSFILSLGMLAIIWFGGQWTAIGNFTVGEILAFTNYLTSALFPVLVLSIIAGQISIAAVSASRILQVIDTEPKVREKPGAINLSNTSGRIVFEDVCFSYEENCLEPVLRNINFVAEPGQNVAILGATGSGKSSLIDLIPRFYDVTRGRITIDGIDLRDATIESLRRQVSIVLQETILFTGTIRDNIRYGQQEATEQEVVAAAEAAQAHNFIISFPEGYDTLVGQRGVNLSGGQKQRIAIARALLVKPRILILDDSTSAVDVETEIKIQDALKSIMKECTTFTIAQRISSVLQADQIIVLDRGEIVAQGTHTELMSRSPIYREIYESQLGEGGTIDE